LILSEPDFMNFFPCSTQGTGQISSWRPGFLVSAVLPILFTAACAAFSQTQTPIRIDASAPFTEPSAALYDGGTAASPSGHVLGLNDRYLTFDGKPWLPVMGEFHFSRYPSEQWEEELLKMKAAGVNIVSTYVLWIHHEEVEGQFDWSGQRDLHAFAEICAKHGLLLVVRIGPWDHAEVRNGGLPDWVLKQGATRVNDPAYLASVRIWYEQTGTQLHGLLWKDGGPVIGIQIENEYSNRGPGGGEQHILKLKEMALAAGFDVPFYFVTGWDAAVIPPRAVLPVYGGYPDAPWDDSPKKLPPAEVYAFRFHSRAASNMGAIGDAANPSAAVEAAPLLPYMTAEMGGGNEVTYHRRPVIQPEDIAALVPVMIGSGVNLYGSYMFQGGENPDGKLTTLQESQATGYPNDVPIKSYDFQAPLGEFGQERESLRKLKVFQYFLNDFGSMLAPMTVHAPAVVPKDPADFTVPRASVRSRGNSGFIFFNNHVRGYSMPTRPATQFEIHLPGSTLLVPRSPVDIPSGAAFIWPFHLAVNGIDIRYSTAQLFARIDSLEETTLFFEAIPGIAPEFAFEEANLASIKPATGQTAKDSGVVYLSGIRSSPDSRIDLVSAQGGKLRIIILTATEAENGWKARTDGQERVLITDREFFADDKHISLRSMGSPEFSFSTVPPMRTAPRASLKLEPAGPNQSPGTFTAMMPARNLIPQVHLDRAAGEASPVKTGPQPSWRKHPVAQAPSEAPLAGAARWHVKIPANALDGLADLFLEVNYQGDVARFSGGGKLLDDDFFNGEIWSIGLKRFLNPGKESAFDLSILPLRKDAPFFLEPAKPIRYAKNGQVCSLDRVRLVPEYELAIDTDGQ
jgi:hypothetical protein